MRAAGREGGHGVAEGRGRVRVEGVGAERVEALAERRGRGGVGAVARAKRVATVGGREVLVRLILRARAAQVHPVSALLVATVATAARARAEVVRVRLGVGARVEARGERVEVVWRGCVLGVGGAGRAVVVVEGHALVGARGGVEDVGEVEGGGDEGRV